MEQLSLMTNWKLAGVLLYNQDRKKDTQVVRQEWRNCDQVWICAPRRGLTGERRLDGLTGWVKPQTGNPSLEVLLEGNKSLWLVGGPRDGQKFWRSLDSAHEEHTCIGQPQRQGSERSALVAAAFSMTTSPGAPARASKHSGSTPSMPQWGTYSGVPILREQIWLRALPDWGPGSTLDLCMGMGPPCLGTPLLWGKGPDTGRGKKPTLKGNSASSSPTLRASAPTIWAQILPWEGSDDQ